MVYPQEHAALYVNKTSPPPPRALALWQTKINDCALRDDTVR